MLTNATKIVCKKSVQRLANQSLIVLSTLAFGCTTTSPEDSDRSLSDRSKVQKPLESLAVVSPEKAFGWQKFYVNKPAKTERRSLSEQINTWNKRGPVEGTVAKARASFALGNYDDAESLYQTGVRNASLAWECLYGLGELYLDRGRLTEASDILEQLRQLPRRSIELITRFEYLEARTAITMGHRQLGRQQLLALLSKQPSFLPAYEYLAQTYLADRTTNQAQFIVRRAVDKVGPKASLHNLMGVSYLIDGDLTAADQFFHEALRLNPNHVPSLTNRANLDLLNLEIDAANTNLQRVVEITGFATAAVETLRGIIADHRGLHAEAIRHHRQAVKLSPNNPKSRFLLASALLSSAEFNSTETDHSAPTTEALRLLNEVVQLSSNDDQLKQTALNRLEQLKGLVCSLGRVLRHGAVTPRVSTQVFK